MEINQKIQWATVLEGLTSEQSRVIEESFTYKMMPARMSIFNQGDESNVLLVVNEGRVRLFQRTASGEEFTTCMWSKGYVIGLISAFLGEQRFLSAESIEASSLSLLKRDDLLQLMEQIPRFGLNIGKLLALLASHSIKRTVPLALNTASMRLGKVLCDLAQPQHNEELSRFYIIKGLSQEDLAHMVGASRPWVNQTLSSFEHKGLIHRGKGQIIIPDYMEFKGTFDR